MSIGLYIHIPFCIKKCAYCDFVSFTCLDTKKYLEKLFEELDIYKGEKIDTVYIGGGTPTCLSLNEIESLLVKINKNFNLKDLAEWTIEANPKTIDKEKLALLRKHNVNRISLGVQSFNDRELKELGRIHNSSKAKESIFLAKEYFDNFNIDIMQAIPLQTKKSFVESINTAISFSPAHISCYSLIIEKGTLFYEKYKNKELDLVDEEEDMKMYESAREILEKNGYNRYEISNFAKDNKECLHNLKYWQCENYIGAGLAAHSFVGTTRFQNTTDMKKYLLGERIAEKNNLSENELKQEFIIMHLRLKNGVNTKEYKRRFNTNFYQDYKEIIDKFIKTGHIRKNDTNFALTDKGIDVSNSIMCEFI